jgi:hypothetical protein
VRKTYCFSKDWWIPFSAHLLRYFSEFPST